MGAGRCFAVSGDGLPSEYSQVRPSPYVYKRNAEKIVDYLEKSGYIK